MSLARIEQWDARRSSSRIGYLRPRALRERLDATGLLVKESLGREGTDEEREAWFIEEARLALRRMMSESDARRYEAAGRFDLNWRGLARYWRKKEPRS